MSENKCPRCNIKMSKTHLAADTSIHYNISLSFWKENSIGVYHCKKCMSRKLGNGNSYPNYFAFFNNGQIYQYADSHWELVNTEELKKEKGKYVGGFKIIQ